MSEHVFAQIGVHHAPDGRCLPQRRGGLTKRELFAAMAMQGLLQGDGDHDISQGSARQFLAAASVWIADVLIAELAKEPPPSDI